MKTRIFNDLWDICERAIEEQMNPIKTTVIWTASISLFSLSKASYFPASFVLGLAGGMSLHLSQHQQAEKIKIQIDY
ncbi:hypothetical protein CYL18_03915 [Pradoshia eiseniae]|uniref:Uncharacterized protein n=1 Tax=Pradoshia eiseniae TaxID=2064768 RepID=A0A2S7N4Z8_9BACI|nr:hypothetical protein CYL18_03915 [Pradoshia eiseniae]